MNSFVRTTRALTLLFSLTGFIAYSAWSAELDLENDANAAHSKIVYLGDSQSMAGFGDEIQKDLQLTGSEVQSLSACGFNALSYFKRAKNACGKVVRTGSGTQTSKRILSDHGHIDINEYLTSPAPILTIIALGSNDWGYTNGSVKSSASHLLAEVTATGSKCIWIGPPPRPHPGDDDKVDGIVNALKTAAQAAGCDFLPTNDVGTYGRPVGDIHYGPVQTKKRAEAVWKKIQTLPVFKNLFPSLHIQQTDPAVLSYAPRIQADGSFTSSKNFIFRKAEVRSQNLLIGNSWQEMARGRNQSLTWTELKNSMKNCVLAGAYCEVGEGEASNGSVTESPALEACKKIGARLPSVADYEHLFNELEKEPSGLLSGKGLKDFSVLFPGVRRTGWYWTSSIGPAYADAAYYLDASSGDLSNYSVRLKPGSVLCVSP